MKRIHIFDLDQTVVNSDHRVLPLLDENRNLDLQRYKDEACKHHLIQQDTLLPLAGYMRQLIQAGEQVIICTARFMSKSDYIFLRKNGLRAPLVLSRDQLHKHFKADQIADIYNSGDGKYKGYYFDMLLERFGKGNEFIMYDDHQGVLVAARERGFTAIDAISLNLMLDVAYENGFTDAEAEAWTESESLIDCLTSQLLGNGALA